jgi:hypothetical protein
MVSTRIGALTVGSLRNRIWIAFGMELFGHAWLAADDAYAIADWLEANGRAHGATILRAMLGEKVTVDGGEWSESVRLALVESRVTSPRE